MEGRFPLSQRPPRLRIPGVFRRKEGVVQVRDEGIFYLGLCTRSSCNSKMDCVIFRPEQWRERMVRNTLQSYVGIPGLVAGRKAA